MEADILADVQPTEEWRSVKKAIRQLFPGIALALENEKLKGSTQDMEVFKEKLEKQRIRDSTRAHIMDRLQGNKAVFFLNKQAAFQGKINITEENCILGPIQITLRSDDFDEDIQKLTATGKKELDHLEGR